MAAGSNGSCSTLDCIVEYTLPELQAGSDASQPVTISRSGENLRAATFDVAGNLWMTEFPTATASSGLAAPGDIVEFKNAMLNGTASTTALTPSLVVPLAGVPDGIAFDPSGNLWVVVRDPSGATVPAIEKFSGAPSSTSAVPIVTIEGSASGFSYSGIAFTADGTLWCSLGYSFGPAPAAGLYGFVASQLAASGNPTATYVLMGPSAGAPLAGQLAVAAFVKPLVVDPAGNLWSSDFGVLYEYAASLLHASQSAPSRSFQAFATANPGGQTTIESFPALAFDRASVLYASFPGKGLEVYLPSAYESSSPVPSETIPATSSNPVPRFITSGPAATSTLEPSRKAISGHARER